MLVWPARGGTALPHGYRSCPLLPSGGSGVHTVFSIICLLSPAITAGSASKGLISRINRCETQLICSTLRAWEVGVLQKLQFMISE